jgi:hypothetical protein
VKALPLIAAGVLLSARGGGGAASTPATITVTGTASTAAVAPGTSVISTGPPWFCGVQGSNPLTLYQPGAGSTVSAATNSILFIEQIASVPAGGWGSLTLNGVAQGALFPSLSGD